MRNLGGFWIFWCYKRSKSWHFDWFSFIFVTFRRCWKKSFWATWRSLRSRNAISFPTGTRARKVTWRRRILILAGVLKQLTKRLWRSAPRSPSKTPNKSMQAISCWLKNLCKINGFAPWHPKVALHMCQNHWKTIRRVQKKRQRDCLHKPKKKCERTVLISFSCWFKFAYKTLQKIKNFDDTYTLVVTKPLGRQRFRAKQRSAWPKSMENN